MLKGVACIAFIVTLFAAGVCFAASPDSRQDPSRQTTYQAQQRQTTKQHQSNRNETLQSCPTTLRDLAHRVDVCAKPLMDLLEGSIERWPQSENDILDLCQSFAGSEKCIKETGRKCAKGLQRTIISTIANSVARARKRECTKPKLPMFLKTTQCIERNNQDIRALIANATSRLYVIEDQMKDLDQKTNSVCCMVNEIEDNIKTTLGPKCPAETKVIVSLYRAVLEDVIELICRTPKCKDIFKAYTIPRRLNTNEGIIQVLTMILFSLG